MSQMLEQVLFAAADAVSSHAAVMWMFTATRDRLFPLVTRGVDGSLAHIPATNGIAGSVAVSGKPIALPSTRPEDRNIGPAPGEPRFANVIAAPLISRDRVMAVLTLYRRSGERSYSQQDIETVSFLTEQGGVAIENVLLHEEAQRLSLTDGLTGLWNRRYFEMQFRQVLATATRFDRPFAVLMLDLDRFKNVNDTYGHQVGDGALVEFAHRVRDSIREVDTFARYGGEEFICLLSETDLEGALTTAEKIHREVRQSPMDIEGQPVSMTVSIGIASYPDHGSTFSELADAADRALYRAKQDGRDRVSLPGPSSTGRLHSAN
jgi:diguanylate cyclase (GGDEF)-like protein